MTTAFVIVVTFSFLLSRSMSNFTVSRLGEVNALGGDDRELFLRLFAGEVAVAFQAANIMKPLHRTRTIPYGKSATFPRIGTATAHYHQPGTELTGQQIKHNEVEIFVDDMLVADVFIANIDEAMNHYEVRSEYASQCGYTLASRYDQNVIRVALKAARTSTPIIAGETNSVGTVLKQGANVAADADTLEDSLIYAARVLDEKNVPDDARHVIIRPAQFYLLLKSGKFLNRDFGGQGSIATGELGQVSGLYVHKTNNIPSDNKTTKAQGERNDYTGDNRDTVAVVFHPSFGGTVQLRDLAVETETTVRHQGTLLVAKYILGHGVLRPESAVEISKASQTPA